MSKHKNANLPPLLSREKIIHKILNGTKLHLSQREKKIFDKEPLRYNEVHSAIKKSLEIKLFDPNVIHNYDLVDYIVIRLTKDNKYLVHRRFEIGLYRYGETQTYFNTLDEAVDFYIDNKYFGQFGAGRGVGEFVDEVRILR